MQHGPLEASADGARTANPRRVGRAVQTRTGGAADGREVGRAMKRGTPDHPKTLALAAELELDIASTLGILEMLCGHFAPAYCPQGDIGKWSDAEIARGLKSSIPPERLLPALVRTKWLDEHPKHRLVIHDWA